MRSRSTLVAAAGLFVLVVAALPRCGHGPERPVVLASWAITPGVLNPDVTQATVRSTICVSGWTRTVRPPTDYTNRLKVVGMRAYGLHGSSHDYQEDHLISLELGGNPT